jgi:hypothetical protein
MVRECSGARPVMILLSNHAALADERQLLVKELPQYRRRHDAGVVFDARQIDHETDPQAFVCFRRSFFI